MIMAVNSRPDPSLVGKGQKWRPSNQDQDRAGWVRVLPLQCEPCSMGTDLVTACKILEQLSAGDLCP